MQILRIQIRFDNIAKELLIKHFRIGAYGTGYRFGSYRLPVLRRIQILNFKTKGFQIRSLKLKLKMIRYVEMKSINAKVISVNAFQPGLSIQFFRKRILNVFKYGSEVGRYLPGAKLK